MVNIMTSDATEYQKGISGTLFYFIKGWCWFWRLGFLIRYGAAYSMPMQEIITATGKKSGRWLNCNVSVFVC